MRKLEVTLEGDSSGLRTSNAPPYRPDMRERLQGVANEMHLLQATSVALVSDVVADDLSDWSEPVEMRVVREQDGIVSLEFRKPK